MASPADCPHRLAGISIVFSGQPFPAPSNSKSSLRNPADAFKKRLPKVERREMKTLTAEQSAHLLEAIAHSRVYWPVLLATRDRDATRRGAGGALEKRRS